MKIFKIWQTINHDYDTYSDAVVIAKDEADARRIHPADINEAVPIKTTPWCEWCGLNDVHVEYIGEAKKGSKRSIVCASFRAG